MLISSSAGRNIAPGRQWGQAIALFAFVSSALSLLLLALRAVSAISFSEPLLTITSGAEEESTFALWKYAHGFPVYTDPYVPPFAASYYNWLFYVVYGGFVAVGVHILGLADAWIPTIARLPSLAFAMLGAAVAYGLFRPSFVSFATSGQVVAATFALFVFFGPLIGFWAISVNPELAATAVGLAAIAAFLRLHPRMPLGAIIVVSLLSYLAWSFKQTHVFAPGALALFLLIRHNWRGLSVLVALQGLAVLATLAASTDMYRLMILYHVPVVGKVLGAGGAGLVFDGTFLMRNLINFATKLGPLLAICAVPLVLVTPGGEAWRRIKADDRLLVALCGTVVSAALTIPASAKLGASETYYFPLSAFIAFAVVAAWPHLADWPTAARAMLIALAVGWLANAVATTMVLTGRAGVLSVWSWHEKLAAQRDCIAATKGPRFFTQTHLALPWINPSGPYFVYAYNYLLDRFSGRPFPQGAIHDLIASGYFGTLIVPADTAPNFDGAAFDLYHRVPASCAGLWIYTRIENGAPGIRSTN